MKAWGKRGPNNPERSEAMKLLEECAGNLLWAFRSLASAGEPRMSKAQRAHHIESAAQLADRIRADCARARDRFAGCQHRLTQRAADGRAEPHDQAAVTALAPLVKTTTGQVQALSATLLRYMSGASYRPVDSAERREADRFRSSWADDGLRHRCNWCGQAEQDKWLKHYPLDRDGFAIARQSAVRFVCHRCFDDGKDLANPAPKALPPARLIEPDGTAEIVACVPVSQPLLSAGAAEHETSRGSN